MAGDARYTQSRNRLGEALSLTANPNCISEPAITHRPGKRLVESAMFILTGIFNLIRTNT